MWGFKDDCEEVEEAGGNEPGPVVEGAQDREIQEWLKPSQS